jgi:hypothetical protein
MHPAPTRPNPLVKAAVEIHAPVQNAYNVDAVINAPVKNHMRSFGEFAVAVTNTIAGFAALWRLGHGLDCSTDEPDIIFGLFATPMFRRNPRSRRDRLERAG